jgi:hypothetical protein
MTDEDIDRAAEIVLICDALESAWLEKPWARLGQLLVNLRGTNAPAIFSTQDVSWLKMLREGPEEETGE